MSIDKIQQCINENVPVEFYSPGGWHPTGWHEVTVTAIDEVAGIPCVFIVGEIGKVMVNGRTEIENRLRMIEEGVCDAIDNPNAS